MDIHGIHLSLAILDTVALGLLALMLTPMIKGEAMTMPLLGKLGPSSYPWLLLVVCALMILKAILALVIQWFCHPPLCQLRNGGW